MVVEEFFFTAQERVRASGITIQQIDKLETLREKWGFRKRGAVLERLLEVVLEEDKEIPKS